MLRSQRKGNVRNKNYDSNDVKDLIQLLIISLKIKFNVLNSEKINII